MTCSNIRKYFKEYCDSTSIHGFQYFGQNRSIFERIWWATVFICCLSGCGFMIYVIYDKYEKSPVIVTFATKETPIYKIPFPAITICPETKSVKGHFDFKKTFEKKIEKKVVSDYENRLFQYTSLLCDNHSLVSGSNTTVFTKDFFDALEMIKPDFMNHAHSCKFMGKDYDCRDILTPVMTDEGVCYSFNILDRTQIFNDLVNHYKDYHTTREKSPTWSIEVGYLEEKKFDVHPRRALLAGAANGFTIHLATLKKDIDYRCKGVQGYRVLLHTPIRMPRLKQEFFRVPLDQSVVTAVQPVMITTSDAVKTYNIQKRDCCFPSERKLKYFRSYSQLNCQLECLTNYTLNTCGCVNFFMPRDNQTDVCGTGKYKCMREAESTLQTEGVFEKFNSLRSPADLDCDCMPLCTDLSYHIETSQTNWDWEEGFRFSDDQLFDSKLMHLSSLTVYFKFNHFITSERNELYGPTDFLANFGGLLGLFTGFSILSLMEIIYFLTLRICCNIKLYGRWIGDSQ